MIERYKRWRRHRRPPAEVTRSLRAAGIAALDISHRQPAVHDHGLRSDRSSSAKSTDDSDDPHVQAWEALMGELQQELPFPRKEASAGKWQLLGHIYSLAAQP